MKHNIQLKLTHFPKKCIVMDFDGTLVDSMKLFSEMWKFAFVTLDPNLDNDKFDIAMQECLGMSAEFTRSKMLQTFNLESRAEEAKELRAKFRENTDYTKYEISDTRELLDKLCEKNISLSIHSNGDRHIIQPILEQLDYLKYFLEITFGNEFGISKPDPAMLFDLMKRKNYKSEELIYWGDNEVDKQYAENAGIDYVITDTSFPREKLFDIFNNNSN